MAQMFDVMSTINGQLNILAKYFSGETKSIRSLPNAPDFIMVSINRGINIFPYLAYPEKDIVVRHTIISDTGDDFNPVYIAVVDNLQYPFVDKIPVVINNKDITGPGIAYGVYIPTTLFTETESPEQAADRLKHIYLDILNFDINMKYKPELSIIKYSESPKLNVSTYDLMMMYTALCCININLKAWYTVTLGKGKYAPIDSSYTVDLLREYIKDNEDDNLRSRIYEALEKYGTKIGNLRDGIGSGSLLKDIMFPDK